MCLPDGLFGHLQSGIFNHLYDLGKQCFQINLLRLLRIIPVHGSIGIIACALTAALLRCRVLCSIESLRRRFHPVFHHVLLGTLRKLRNILNLFIGIGYGLHILFGQWNVTVMELIFEFIGKAFRTRNLTELFIT